MKTPTLIFHIGHSAGFYSEFNNMVIAILYCRKHGIDFNIYSSDSNFRIKKAGKTTFYLSARNRTTTSITTSTIALMHPKEGSANCYMTPTSASLPTTTSRPK